ncbi:hypothetical protein V4842_04530 [Pseudomonas moraviensis]
MTLHLSNDTSSVGAAEGCDLLALKEQEQKIAAFGSSYKGEIARRFLCGPMQSYLLVAFGR